jgi:hypothetical protein
MKRFLFLCVMTATAFSADTLHTFSAGDTARAFLVNENFSILLERITTLEGRSDSLSTRLGDLQDSLAQTAGLANETKTKADNLESVADALEDSIARAKAINMLPIGTVVASMLAPEKYSEMMGRDSANWTLADGRVASTEYFNATGKSNIPDLRGAFIRGLNVDRDDGKEDPEGNLRIAGDYQQDEFKSHSHTFRNHSIGGTDDGSFGITRNEQLPYQWLAVTSSGGSETRPKNVAVYWYIKIK